jgi:putative ABC transport system permease protein
MEDYLSDAVAPRRFSLVLITAFALAALALAATGIYAVVTYSIGQRAREIAIRVALGATPSNIVRLVAGRCFLWIGLGLVLGLGVAIDVTRLLSTMLFEQAPTDAVTFGQVAILVTGVSGLACAIPTIRLLKVRGASLSTE